MRLDSVSSLVRRTAFLFACLASAAALSGQSTAPAAQPSPSEPQARAARIQQQLTQLHQRQKANASGHEIAIRWALIGAEYGNAGNVTQAEAAYNHALELVSADKQELQLYADILDQLGALYRIYGRTEDALRSYSAALAIRAPFLDPLQDARSRARLAEIALISRHYQEAYAETDQAYRSMLHMSDPDTSEVLSALIVRAYAQCGLRNYQAAKDDATQALKLSRQDFTEDSLQAAASLVALGFAQLKNNQAAEAEASLHHAVQLFHAQLSASDPRLRFAMQQYHQSLVRLHRSAEARQVRDELAAIDRQAQPACANCTISAFSLRSPAAGAPSATAGKCALSSGGATAAWKPAESAPQEQ